jgi:energy-coupling factor transporter ATP-binding protein EcfA2
MQPNEISKMGRKEILVRRFFTEHHADVVPIDQTVQQLYSQFMANTENSEVSYGLFNGVVKKLHRGFNAIAPTGRNQVPLGEGIVESDEPDNVEPPKVIEIGSMAFPNFKRYRTGGLIDLLLSDHTEDGGLYSGTANIVVGESGVGKSTVMLQMLAQIKREHPDARILYVSSEMTRNDLFFFYAKMPIIGSVPTLLLMDHIMGRFDIVLKNTINSDEYDIILLDSYQDTIVKMVDVLGWKSTRAATWLTNMIIEAADKNGKAIFAIQHLTKGGQYVGSTYLKHATTAMMEMRFDENGRRYVEFSKNRRGGTNINKRLYFSLVNGELVWDEEAWKQEIQATDLANGESSRRAALEGKFSDLFLSVGKKGTEEETESAEVEADEDQENQ